METNDIVRRERNWMLVGYVTALVLCILAIVLLHKGFEASGSAIAVIGTTIGFGLAMYTD